MKIGIKFCGGCNPKYDRKYAESVLRKYISKEHTIDYVKAMTMFLLSMAAKLNVPHLKIFM